MTTNIPSYPRHIRAVDVGVHASRCPGTHHSLCVESTKKGGFVDFFLGGGLLKQYYLLKVVRTAYIDAIK